MRPCPGHPDHLRAAIRRPRAHRWRPTLPAWSGTTTSRSMMGLASGPGTAILPMCTCCAQRLPAPRSPGRGFFQTAAATADLRRRPRLAYSHAPYSMTTAGLRARSSAPGPRVTRHVPNRTYSSAALRAAKHVTAGQPIGFPGLAGFRYRGAHGRRRRAVPAHPHKCRASPAERTSARRNRRSRPHRPSS